MTSLLIPVELMTYVNLVINTLLCWFAIHDKKGFTVQDFIVDITDSTTAWQDNKGDKTLKPSVCKKNFRVLSHGIYKSDWKTNYFTEVQRSCTTYWHFVWSKSVESKFNYFWAFIVEKSDARLSIKQFSSDDHGWNRFVCSFPYFLCIKIIVVLFSLME